MNFLSKFLSNFTEEEQQSELVRIMASIGVNMETSIIEAYNQDIQSSTELINFPDSRLRSWLAYFFVPVPNYRSAVGSISLTIEQATTQVSISKGMIVKSMSGISYEIQDSIVVSPGATISLTIEQGTLQTANGIYNTIISIPAENVDISDLTVVVGDKYIPAVSKVQDFVLPRDGYFAFVYDGVLYIKVYTGDNVEDPTGMQYFVQYRVSDGKKGNTGINTIEKFEETLLDIQGNEVEYSIKNSAITGGLNEPEHYELVNLLRYTFFIHGSIASVPEYTIWFDCQSSVGDVLVQSDFERWLDARKKDPSATIDITGIIKVYLLGLDGEPMTSAEILNLEADLVKIRDIAVLKYEEPSHVSMFFKIQYAGSTNDTLFQQNARTIIQNFFNIPYLKNRDLSIFEDLDSLLVYNQLVKLYSVSGLNIVPYHFTRVTVDSYVSEISVNYYNGESPNGYYKLYALNEDQELELVDTLYEVDGPISCVIQKSDGTVVGARGENNISIQWQFIPGMQLECYWPLQNPGFISIGSPNSFRKLEGVEFEVV